MTPGRRLSAILAADVAGFSRLMEADEAGAIAAIGALRDLADTMVARHGGRVVGTAGDSFLAEFSSVVSAVEAAIAVQSAMSDIDGAGPQANRVQLRIGVNLGDVVVDADGDILGEGVNVAARLQAVAAPGGICVSQAVYESVRTRISLDFVDVGLRLLKNIEKPVQVWSLLKAAESATSPRAARVASRPEGPEALPPLERDVELRTLRAALDTAAAGTGRFALVSGEAGIGKTTLVRHFVRSAGSSVRILRGACDDLLTPRPLGPFHDLAFDAGGGLASAMEGGSRNVVFDAVLEELSRPPAPVLLVIEDVHWADAATIDVLSFIGRRVDTLAALVVVTYRDEEIHARHPLNQVLGSLPAHVVVRIRPRPLSREAVSTLTGQTGTRSEDLHRVTGGNPFFVTEALASSGRSGVPATVRDAVLARTSKLGAEARALLDLASVVPGRIETWLTEACEPDPWDALDECERAGLLQFADNAIGFRHELARRAIEDALSSSRRRGLNRKVVAALCANHADAARIVHHAEAGGDIETLVRFAPEAARRAASVNSHREALSHYERALIHENHFDPPAFAQLLEEAAVEYYITNHGPEAVVALDRALGIRREQGDALAIGHDLRWLSRVHWFTGNRQSAEMSGLEAIEVLESATPGHELARAYSNLSQLSMLAYNETDTVKWGTKAIDLARELGDDATLAHALNNVGSEVWRKATYRNDADRAEEGRQMLLQSLTIAREHGMYNDACRSYANLSWHAVDHRDYANAKRWIDEGLELATEKEETAFVDYLRATDARLALDTGDWDRAESIVTALRQESRITGVGLIPVLEVMGRLLARRGDFEQASSVLRDAMRLAERSDELQRIGPVSGALAELAWLSGRPGTIPAITEKAYALALRVGDSKYAGELAWWRWVTGQLDEIPDVAARPWSTHMAGDARSAAAEWAAFGCPWERALTLLHSSEPADQLEALALFEQLGASAAADLARSRMD